VPVEDGGISERDVRRQACLLIRRKADYASTPADIGAAVDERIEHQRQKLIGQLKHRALGASRRLAIELGQRTAERAAG
jgi:hypothetical protein